MTDDKAVLVDTNVLLSATAPGRPLHRAALTVLNHWPNQGTILATSSQVLRDYLVVATRPVEVNGLGLSTEDALANVAPWRCGSFPGAMEPFTEPWNLSRSHGTFHGAMEPFTEPWNLSRSRGTFHGAVGPSMEPWDLP